MLDEYIDPPVVFSKKAWAAVIVMIIFLYFEFAYMYTWCKWFTNC